MAALALESENCVDHMFEHARSGDRPVLGHMADEHERGAAVLGVADEFLRARADLAHRPRRAVDEVAVHRLDRIDHDEIGAAPVERREDVAHRRRACERDGRVAEPQALRAQSHLRRRLFAADIDDRLAAPRQSPGRLQQQRRFADPRIAADQRCRPRDEAATQCAIKFGNPAQHPVGHDAVRVERLKCERASAAGEVMLRRKGRLCRLFDQRVPLAAIGALPLPAIGRRPAILAYILAFRFGHGYA